MFAEFASLQRHLLENVLIKEIDGFVTVFLEYSVMAKL
jgi:hypothetical protein